MRDRVFNFPSEFPVLESKRLTLSMMKTSDAKELFAIRADKEFTEFLSSKPYQKMEEAEAVIEKNQSAFKNREGLSWKIALKGDAKMIGYIGFWRIDKANFRGEVGFGLDKNHRNVGYTSEALDAILEYGFKELNLHSVMADTDPLNKASIKVLEKTGFQKEAHIRENYYFNGQFADTYLYGILENQFRR